MITILLTYANAEHAQLKNLEKECKDIQFILEAVNGKGYEVKMLPATSPQDLITYLKTFGEQMEVFHYSGHANGKELATESQHTDSKALADVLTLYCPNLKLAFLNGCQTQHQVQNFHRIGVPYVIATNAKVRDNIAYWVAKEFYENLSKGNYLEKAFAQLEANSKLLQQKANLVNYRGIYFGDKETHNEFEWGLYSKYELIKKLYRLPINNQTVTPSMKNQKKSDRVPVQKPPQHLIDEIKAGNVIPVIGAGLSKAAVMSETSNPSMPNYKELLQQLLDAAKKLGGIDEIDIYFIEKKLEINKTRDASNKLTELIGKGGIEFQRILRRILSATEQENIKPSLVHKLLSIFDFPYIITTNWDRFLEKLVAPNHEVITPFDRNALELLNGSLINRTHAKYLLKMHGDITRPLTILFGEDRLRDLYQGNSKDFNRFRKFIVDIFHTKTVLFLGFSFKEESEGFIKSLRESIKNDLGEKPSKRHYALVPVDSFQTEKREKLQEDTNIVFLTYEPDDAHSQVAEFVSYLNPAKVDDPKLGKKWAQWYLPAQREEYLVRQLLFEEEARSVRYLTPTLTNAIGHDDHIRVTCFNNLLKKNMITNARQNENFVFEQVIPAMLKRRDNLVEKMKDSILEVRILFLKNSLEQDFDQPNKIVVERYKYLLELMQDKRTDLEIRVLQNLSADELKADDATYALILSDQPKPNVDATIAYASQATKNYFNIHMIETNTDRVQEKVYQFERYWASAMSEQATAKLIKELIKANE